MKDNFETMTNKKKQKIKNLLNQSKGFLTEGEIQLLEKQIRYNSVLIDHYIHVIDLLANKERCPKDANTLVRMRNRLSVAIAENDTFRTVLWRHVQQSQVFPADGESKATAFLIAQIKIRRQAAISQMARK